MSVLKVLTEGVIHRGLTVDIDNVAISVWLYLNLFKQYIYMVHVFYTTDQVVGGTVSISFCFRQILGVGNNKYIR